MKPKKLFQPPLWLKSLEAEEVSEELCLDLSYVSVEHRGFGSFWRLGVGGSCQTVCMCCWALKKSVSSQDAISNLLHHWHASLGSSLWGNGHKYSHFDFIMVTKTLKDTKGQDSMVFVPFAVFLFAFFHRMELVGLSNSGRPGYGNFIRLLAKGFVWEPPDSAHSQI